MARKKTKDGKWREEPSRCVDCGGTCDMDYQTGVAVTDSKDSRIVSGWVCTGCGHFYEEAAKTTPGQA